MARNAGRLGTFVAIAVCAAGCAHSADTVVHVSAPEDARWEVRDEDGEHICSLPCSVELDEEEAVSVVRADGRIHFELDQKRLGEGAFSATVHEKRTRGRDTLAARAFAAALFGAGSVLVKSEKREQVAVGAFLSGMAGVIRVASDGSETKRQELWVRRAERSQ